jgi:hypothetical protein
MLLLPEEQTSEAWEPSKESSDLSEFGEQWMEKYLSVFVAVREFDEIMLSS